jgi:protein-tyrosine phosphatase
VSGNGTTSLLPSFFFSMKATVYRIKDSLPGRIAIVARPRGGDWLCDEIAALSHEGIDVLVSMLTDDEAQELGLATEREHCESGSITFISIPISDRSVPIDKDQFLREANRVAALVRQGHFVGVHCRASIGRSAVLAASILIQLGLTANDAFSAIESARGCPVPDTPEQRQWVTESVR